MVSFNQVSSSINSSREEKVGASAPLYFGHVFMQAIASVVTVGKNTLALLNL